MKVIDRILHPDNMRLAWEEVAARKGSAGIDGVSIKRWRRNWEERLINLAAAVRANTYRPQPVERFTIPKRDGSLRHLTNLTVTDKVLQRAALRVLDDLFERRFLDCSYGYRQGRGVRDAVQAILHWRDAGFQWVLDADIDECFDSLDHSLILAFVREEVDDPIVLRLIGQWLRMGQQEPESEKGIPMGAVISPLLCNLYLHRLDAALTTRGYAIVRYADDFCVFCGTRSMARRAWRDTEIVLTDIRLQLEPNKTAITHFNRGFDFLGVHFHRDTYTFIAAGKQVQVKGKFDHTLFYDYLPEGYT